MANEIVLPHDDNYQLALHHYHEGELARAETLCNSILEAYPDNAKVWHLLGMIALGVNKNSAAIELVNKSILIEPNSPFYYITLAEALQRLGQYEMAKTWLQKALALKANFPEAINKLGGIYLKQHRLDEAEECFRQCIAMRPDFALPHLNLGAACQLRGKWVESIEFHKHVLQLEPRNLTALFQMGCAMQNLGRLNEAIDYFRRVVEIHPDSAEGHLNLAVSLHKTGNLTGALPNYLRTLEIRPDIPEALNSLGYLYTDLGDFEKARAAYDKALTLRPGFFEAWNNLGNMFKMQGNLREAVAHYKRSAELKPDYQAAHDNVLFSLHYVHDASRSEVELAHKDWGNIMSEMYSVGKRSWQVDPSPDKVLRIGFVSADFYMHSVSFFLKDVLDALDTQQVEIYCYSNNQRHDELTEKLMSIAGQWRDITRLSDADAAKLIADDKIDILVDLSGHTKGNRLLIFARKPAPIQATWLGYPNTTGLESIDYRITDAAADPFDSNDWHSEELVRLPDGFLCFGKPIESPDIVDPPCLISKTVTFGTFNNFSKISPQALELWIDILSRVGNSRLLLKVDISPCSTLESVLQLLTGKGVPEEKIKLIPRVPSYREHLSLYGELDIALDVFPYNGTTSTCEAMWMGVPLITLRGDRHVSRVGASLLTRVGLDEFIAESPQDYAGKAVALANDHDKLLKLRHQLRERMQGSALGDPQKFARQLEQAFRDMWVKWQSTR